MKEKIAMELKLLGITANGTKVFDHPAAHTHRKDLAEEAISMMTIPAEPDHPTDRSQTRHCEVLDMGRVIGVNHRIERTPEMTCFWMVRGEGPEKRNYVSLMTLDGKPAPETYLTMVCFWDSETNCWVLYTNYEGQDDPWPEPGTVRYDHLSLEDKKKASAWHVWHPLVCTEAEKWLCLRRPTKKAL